MESRNLIIRESVFEDCRYFAEWEADPEVTRYFNISDQQGYGEVVRKFILDDEDSTVMQFTIVTKADNTPVGRILVTDINREEDSLDLTRIYIADEANRGRGYGTEALSAFLEYAFINLHMERVTVDFIRDNDTADRLFRRQRFQKEGNCQKRLQEKRQVLRPAAHGASTGGIFETETFKLFIEPDFFRFFCLPLKL